MVVLAEEVYGIKSKQSGQWGRQIVETEQQKAEKQKRQWLGKKDQEFSSRNFKAGGELVYALVQHGHSWCPRWYKEMKMNIHHQGISHITQGMTNVLQSTFAKKTINLLFYETFKLWSFITLIMTITWVKPHYLAVSINKWDVHRPIYKAFFFSFIMKNKASQNKKQRCESKYLVNQQFSTWRKGEHVIKSETSSTMAAPSQMPFKPVASSTILSIHTPVINTFSHRHIQTNTHTQNTHIHTQEPTKQSLT